jgi:hypothetical protein
MTDETPAKTVETAGDGGPPTPRGTRRGWLGLTIAIVFGLFYVYDLFAAISNLVLVTSQINIYNEARAVVKLAPVPIPWVWLAVDLLVAPVVFALVFLLGRRRSLPLRILLLFVGLTVVAAVSLTAEALA